MQDSELFISVGDLKKVFVRGISESSLDRARERAIRNFINSELEKDKKEVKNESSCSNV